MKILIYGNGCDSHVLEELISSCGTMQYRNISFTEPENYDAYLRQLKVEKADLVFITECGADGMEAVMAAKNIHPDVEVVWFSDDAGFGIQSYRLGCAYFSADPVTSEIIEEAIKRCKIA